MIKQIVAKYEGRGESGRLAVGKLAGRVGICVNILLFIAKFSLGIAVSSVSVTADAFNNLTDALSSVFVLVGYILAGRPADKEHPFGHARMEYLCGLFISVIITVVGLELLKESVSNLFSSGDVSTPGTVSVIIMASTVVAKALLALFYRALGKAINSTALKASAADSIGDVITTSAVIAGIFLIPVFGSKVDAVLGCGIAIYILILGIKLVFESSGTLLGEAPDRGLVDEIALKLKSYEYVLGIHDLVIHSYGSGALYATVHIEVDADNDIMLTHDRMDNIESDFLCSMGLHLVIHMDPIRISDEETNRYRDMVRDVVSVLADELGEEISMHDFRMVHGVTHSNLIFDLAVETEFSISDRELCHRVSDRVKDRFSTANCVITVDREYNSSRFGREKD